MPLTHVRMPTCTLFRSGHQSFSNNKSLNDLVGNIAHASILVPYHGWRVSHRTHHANHGHVENDESWYPVAKHLYDEMVRENVLHFAPTIFLCLYSVNLRLLELLH